FHPNPWTPPVNKHWRHIFYYTDTITTNILCYHIKCVFDDNLLSIKTNPIFHLFSALLFGGQLESAPGPNRSKYIGCIDTQCDIISVIKDAYENARFLCDQM
ncbi:unnamed protein product, partial [Callosobruchus maculatus]